MKTLTSSFEAEQDKKLFHVVLQLPQLTKPLSQAEEEEEEEEEEVLEDHIRGKGNRTGNRCMTLLETRWVFLAQVRAAATCSAPTASFVCFDVGKQEHF
ncbi:hypothetical protein INR49_005607 [Caranx melampygus]|nr:hypothetical protein INR49_005607 [Caranx melampygus]